MTQIDSIRRQSQPSAVCCDEGVQIVDLMDMRPGGLVRFKSAAPVYLYDPMPEGCIAGWISEEA